MICRAWGGLHMPWGCGPTINFSGERVPPLRIFFVAVTSPSVGPCEVHSGGDATLSHNKQPKNALTSMFLSWCKSQEHAQSISWCLNFRACEKTICKEVFCEIQFFDREVLHEKSKKSSRRSPKQLQVLPCQVQTVFTEPYQVHGKHPFLLSLSQPPEQQTLSRLEWKETYCECHLPLWACYKLRLEGAPLLQAFSIPSSWRLDIWAAHAEQHNTPNKGIDKSDF